MMKRTLLLLMLCPLASLVRAQWTAKDSLRLDRILQGGEEIKLNMDAVKQIEFDPLGAPRVSEDKPWMRFDETLPQVREEKKVVLTLHPYTARTKYNWDPVYQKKINIDARTWEKAFALSAYNSGIALGRRGVTVQGGAIGGLDFMTIFTKDFWDKQGRKNRARALEVLKAYGDSTTVLIPHNVLEPIIR